ncbi:hypothetical protein [Paraflavitalea speifideaquila]|uniref:hypothetical protein n=1 Tax=Paraflavitalea speifideaquila TaxID=3076558 RepID=UPI0028EFE161|nr:hypothetical protein [Paraflavitalea speifideiaquila]
MARNTLANLPVDSMPRLYKLMAYSYMGLKDTTQALHSMTTYFAQEDDSNFVVKDYEVMADLYSATAGKEDSALVFYQTAVTKITDSAALFNYYKKLSDLYKDKKTMPIRLFGWVNITPTMARLPISTCLTGVLRISKPKNMHRPIPYLANTLKSIPNRVLGIIGGQEPIH